MSRSCSSTALLVNARPVAQGRAGAREGLSLHHAGLAARLARACRCRPDADLSPPGVAKLIADFIAALDLDNVTLVGNDTGGAICQVVVTQHPDRIGRLVLTNCDAYDVFPPCAVQVPVLCRPHSRLRVGDRPTAAHDRAAPLADRVRLADEEAGSRARDHRRSWLRPAAGEPRRAARHAEAARRAPARRYTQEAAGDFDEFDKPVLIAWAPEKDFFPVECARAARARLPQGASGADRGLAGRSCPRTSRSASPS